MNFPYLNNMIQYFTPGYVRLVLGLIRYIFVALCGNMKLAYPSAPGFLLVRVHVVTMAEFWFQSRDGEKLGV